MEKCAYLVNSTPKFYGLLPLHFALIRRYADWLTMPLFLATEEPDHPICQRVKMDYGVELIPLRPSEAGFLDSRAYALQQLALTGRFRYVLPMQDDFLLDRSPDLAALDQALILLDKTPIASVRLMPCPGPGGLPMNSAPEWAGISSATDTYGFTFQATLWRLEACMEWYRALSKKLEAEWPVATTAADKRRHVEIRANFAENADGQRFFWEFFKARKEVHVGWKRLGAWSNAVYLSPWPYRPTAVVQGRLEPWAAEMGSREGVPIVL
jgi:hypothetical protein